MKDKEIREVQDAVLMVCRIACAIPLEQVDELRATLMRAHSLGPILQPTEYRDRMPNLERLEQILGPFEKFRRALEPIFQEDMQRVGR